MTEPCQSCNRLRRLLTLILALIGNEPEAQLPEATDLAVAGLQALETEGEPSE